MNPRVFLSFLVAGAALAGATVASAKTPIPGIVTPSGNIRCLYVPTPGHLLCSVKHASYSQREQNDCMARAGLDWHGWELWPTRKVQPVCSGGILYNSNRDVPHYVTLAYGKTWTHGAFACTSQLTGLTCRTRTGHGLFLSRETWHGW
jgi:hypothetical protein